MTFLGGIISKVTLGLGIGADTMKPQEKNYGYGIFRELEEYGKTYLPTQTVSTLNIKQEDSMYNIFLVKKIPLAKQLLILI